MARLPGRAVRAVTADRSAPEGVGTDLGVETEVRPATLGDLFREQYASMVRLAHALTGSNPAAEDLVQDAFARMQARFDQTENPAAYLRTSVVNACRSYHRSRRREQERLHRLDVPDAVSVEARELLDALSELPYMQRAAIVLRYYEDYSERQIAQTLGCRPGTVKSHLHRGLRKLRGVIER